MELLRQEKVRDPQRKAVEKDLFSRDGDEEQPQATSSNNLEVKIDMEVLSGDKSFEGAAAVIPETDDPNEQEVVLRKKTETAPSLSSHHWISSNE